MAGIGFSIRFALSELGPLGVQIEARSPVGIPIALPPPVAALGLMINDFTAGVEFFTSIPDAAKPKHLRDPRFSISASDIDADAWLDQVKKKCPEVNFITHYALLGAYDFIDIYEAPNEEVAAKVSMISLSNGAFQAESLIAIPYKRFVELTGEI